MESKQRKQQCSYEGCRAWARWRPLPDGSRPESEGGALCVAHSGGTRRKSTGAPKGNQNARKHGLYASYVPMVVLEEALDLPAGDLRLEIAVVRGILADLVKSDLPMAELVHAVDEATSALSRLLRTNKHLGDGQPDEFQDAMAQILKGLGLGGA